MNALTQARLRPLSLSDPKLFRTQAYVDGEWIDAESRATLAVSDPASGEPRHGTRPRRGGTRHAIAAAEAALSGWRAKTAKERSAHE